MNCTQLTTLWSNGLRPLADGYARVVRVAGPRGVSFAAEHYARQGEGVARVATSHPTAADAHAWLRERGVGA